MKKIRVIRTPPGFAPEEMREQWVGVVMPCLSPADEEAARQEYPSVSESANSNGFFVARYAAVAALRKSGKDEAAAFWDGLHPFGSFLEFGKDFCEEVA